jgi:thiamine-monophosphate kinase
MSPTLSSLGEFGLIRRFQKRLAARPSKDHVMGIGDDAAVRRITSGRYQLLTHDLFLENIHFLRGSTKDFEDIGWKALAVNLSDIAAMGGEAVEAVVGLGIPQNAKLSQVDAFYRGIQRCAKQFSCEIVGGDTDRSKSGWVIAVTVLGRSGRLPLFRNGAMLGDSLWVTGELGSAALGWELIQKRNHSKTSLPFRCQHSRPTPRLAWGRQLLSSGLVTAMIDVSDGLAGDLRHIAEASRVGFEVQTEILPRHPSFEKLCARFRLKPLDLLLSGGEDYELLFTVKRGSEKSFCAWLERVRLTATLIGRAVQGKEVRFFQQGKRVAAGAQGFTHF